MLAWCREQTLVYIRRVAHPLGAALLIYRTRTLQMTLFPSSSKGRTILLVRRLLRRASYD